MIRLGTRSSKLALAQSGLVAGMITALTGRKVELIAIRTEGDDTSIPLHKAPRPGAFVATVRDALLAGDVDVAVHSFKDLPSAPVAGLNVIAVPGRENPFDVLISNGPLLAELPVGARIGTSSPRRAAALRRVRSDVEIVPIRGNVETRIGFVRSGRVAAAVLAAAGIARLGLDDQITEILSPDVMLPAPAQGALAVECRTDDSLATALAALDHWETRLRVTAERAVLSGINAACTTAIGAYAEFVKGPHTPAWSDALGKTVEVKTADSTTVTRNLNPPSGADLADRTDPTFDTAYVLRLRAELTDHCGVDYATADETLTLETFAPGTSIVGNATLVTNTIDAARQLGLRVANNLLAKGQTT